MPKFFHASMLNRRLPGPTRMSSDVSVLVSLFYKIHSILLRDLFITLEQFVPGFLVSLLSQRFVNGISTIVKFQL
jgi:hypothetical protein